MKEESVPVEPAAGLQQVSPEVASLDALRSAMVSNFEQNDLDVPAFLRTPKAALDVGEYSREPDRGKGAGRAYDSDRDPGHFLDLSDDGTALGGPKLSSLPQTRADYEKALQAALSGGAAGH